MSKPEPFHSLGGIVRLTTSYRDAPRGVLAEDKHHYLDCHIEFTHEEPAIIEQRGLNEVFVPVPASTSATENF